MTSLDHIQYNTQTVGVVAKGCASNLGYKLLRDKIKGKDCECETNDLKYLIRAQKVISCYHAPGTISNSGVLNQSTILFDEDAYGWINATITSSNGELNASVAGVYVTIERAIAELIATYIDTTTYVATYFLNPSGQIVFNIIAPNTVMCGVTYTIDITPKDALHAHVINGGTFDGGQCTVTADDNCITVDQANQIIENINELCGGLCGCQEYFTDSEPIE
jgi:hypothetical protein